MFTFPLNSYTNSLFLRPASLFTNLNGDVLLTCHPLGIPSFTDAANSQRRLRSFTKPSELDFPGRGITLTVALIDI